MTKSTSARKLRCPVCGHPDLKIHYMTDQYEYNSDAGPVTVKTSAYPVESCENCGESYFGPEAIRIRDRAIREALGFMLPEEIQGLRERLGKSPAEFAQMLGVRVENLNHWEAGRLIQDRSVDLLLQLLAQSPGIAQVLEPLTQRSQGRTNPTEGVSSCSINAIVTKETRTSEATASAPDPASGRTSIAPRGLRPKPMSQEERGPDPSKERSGLDVQPGE